MVLRLTPTTAVAPTVPMEVRDRYLWQGDKRVSLTQ
jgi:hypothetical protein